jgi:hypothetical protein
VSSNSILGQDAYTQDPRARPANERFRMLKQRTANAAPAAPWKNNQVRDVRVGRLILVRLFGRDSGKERSGATPAAQPGRYAQRRLNDERELRYPEGGRR